MVCQILSKMSFELKKVASNSINAAQSISRNIAEGYCKRSIREYLQFLYIALGSSGELHSCLFSFLKQDSFQKEIITSWINYTIKQKMN